MRSVFGARFTRRCGNYLVFVHEYTFIRLGRDGALSFYFRFPISEFVAFLSTWAQPNHNSLKVSISIDTDGLGLIPIMGKRGHI